MRISLSSSDYTPAPSSRLLPLLIHTLDRIRRQPILDYARTIDQRVLRAHMKKLLAIKKQSCFLAFYYYYNDALESLNLTKSFFSKAVFLL